MQSVGKYDDGYRHDCWRCKGTGRERAGLPSDAYPNGLSCAECEGTGSREYARLERARRQGWMECEAAMRQIRPGCARMTPWRLLSVADTGEEDQQAEYARAVLRSRTEDEHVR